MNLRLAGNLRGVVRCNPGLFFWSASIQREAVTIAGLKIA